MPHPWTVTSSSLEGQSKKITLVADLKERSKRLSCPCCGEQSRIHDRRKRRWRHLNFGQYETEIVTPVPRTNCTKCGVHQVDVPWARPGSGFTLLSEAGALLLVDEMSGNAAAKILGIQDTRLGRLLRHYADKTHSEADGS